MIRDGYLIAAIACVALALLIAVLAYQWQKHEAQRMEGYRDWIEGRKLP